MSNTQTSEATIYLLTEFHSEDEASSLSSADWWADCSFSSLSESWWAEEWDLSSEIEDWWVREWLLHSDSLHSEWLLDSQLLCSIKSSADINVSFSLMKVKVQVPQQQLREKEEQSDIIVNTTTEFIWIQHQTYRKNTQSHCV